MYPEITFEVIGAVMFVGLFFWQFFKGWRYISIALFIAVWQLLTPLQKWYYDIPQMIMLMILTEVIFRHVKDRI